MENNYLETVRRFYPNAMTTTDAVSKLFAVLKEGYDIEPRQIVYADSICSDDVNAIQYPSNAAEMLGPFKMGGLNGFPFTGLTGMGAFAGHVPEGGALLVYYAPHIGITKDGATGEIRRVGQSQPSGCCGAAKAALNNLLNDRIIPGNMSHLDFQFNAIEQIFLLQKERIKAAGNRLMEATEVMYEAIEQRVNIQAERTKYNCKYLILTGGVLINGDHDMGSFSECRRFELLDLEGKERRNLLDLMKP